MSTRSGYVSIIGKPNVGKSTLLNELLEKKISITADKSQTTRNNIMGIKTHGEHKLSSWILQASTAKKQKSLIRFLINQLKGSLRTLTLYYS